MSNAMAILERIHPTTRNNAIELKAEVVSQPQWGMSGYNNLLILPFDGEKDLGEMGPVRKYMVDHAALRMRSHQLDLESDMCHALFERSAMWGIGAGLKLQAQPKYIRKKDKESLREDFNNQIEELFGVYAASSLSDLKGQKNLHEQANEAWQNMEKGGDVLVVCRLIDGMRKVELIDGAHISTPFGSSGGFTGIDWINPDNNNRVRHGVEMDAAGRHIAYWVHKYSDTIPMGDWERIPVRMDKYPYCEMARMVYGLKYRIDSVRGIPMITSVMETAAKMGRYMSAALASAEERAKIVYTIEHDKSSTGESPLVAQMAKASGVGIFTAADFPTDSYGRDLANTVTATTNKQTFNLTPGSKINSLETKQEMAVRDFFEVNFDIVCAVIGYPPEVIMSKYDSNYSASRAAIKDFEHTLLVKRNNFARQFYQLVYNFCLDIFVLTNTVDLPGYLEALGNRDEFALAGYRSAEWVGDTVPHIDPYKEVQAWRLKMGAGTEHIPLCTAEQAAEALSGLDVTSVMEQSSKERLKADELGIEKVEMNRAVIEDFDTPTEDEPGKPNRQEEDSKEEEKEGNSNKPKQSKKPNKRKQTVKKKI